LETAESGTAQENAGVSTSTAYDSNYRFYLNNSEWKYFYFDFAWFLQ